MDEPVSFGTWLRRARVARDLTQEALAEQVGCSTQTVRAFESSRRRPSREMAARLAAILELPQEQHDQFVRLARTTQPVAHQAAAAPAAEQLTPPVSSSSPAGRPGIVLPSDPLIGRHADLQHLRTALLEQQHRMLTLLGPGGIGKTRLALQAAADLAPHFHDGVAFVALAPVADAYNVVTAIAEAINAPLPAAQSPETALLGFLRERAMLLVFDNLEHLLGAPHGSTISDLFIHILRDAPQVFLLITSRERLRLREEWVVELDGLALPADERAGTIERSEAVLLFLERARQVAGDFALTAHNRAAVTAICRLLGGMPLAIELAASWVRVLSCEEISAEIRRGADIEGLDRNLPARHRSLHAVIEHSWMLLSASEQRLLMHMSVFQGGSSREAIAAVYLPADPALGVNPSQPVLLSLLAALVDKSLVRRQTGSTGMTRYDLHELVRQYAAARLAHEAGQQPIAARHAGFYADWVGQQEAILKGARQKQAVQAIVIEIDNIRAAWRWAYEQHNAGLLLQMFFTLDWFYEVHGWNAEAEALFAQGNAALAAVAFQEDAPNELQTCYWLLVGREGWHALRRDPAYSANRMQAATTALRDVNVYGGLMHVIKGLAYLRIFAGDYVGAQALLDEALMLAEHAGDLWARSVALVVRAVLETLRSEPATARHYLHEALGTARQVGDPRHVALTLNYYGVTALNLGQLDEAERVCREAMALATEQLDRFQMSLALQTLGRVALLRGDYTESEWLLNESLAVARDIRDRWLEAQALGRLGTLANARGNRLRARQFHRGALTAAAAAPAPIALDELAALAEFELAEQPGAALAAFAYVQSHPLTRPAVRERVSQLLSAAVQASDTAVQASSLAHEQPSALLSLFES